MPVLLGVLGLAVVALVAVLVLELTRGGDAAAGQATPTRYEVYEAGEANELLADREVDARPLTEDEVFDRGSTELSGQDIDFTLESRSLSDNCAEAVWGPKALAALETTDCSQVALGGYVSDDYVGVSAIFKLRDTEAAQALAEGLTPPEDGEEAETDDAAGGFLVPPAAEAPLNTLGAGFSSAQATVTGHYLLVTWTQSRDSDSAEEVENLDSPLIALTKFDMPIFYRVNEREDFLANNGGGQESPGVEVPTEEGTG